MEKKQNKQTKNVKLLNRVRLFATPWTVAYQSPPSMGFSRQEYWSGLPFPSPEKNKHPPKIMQCPINFPTQSRATFLWRKELVPIFSWENGRVNRMKTLDLLFSKWEVTLPHTMSLPRQWQAHVSETEWLKEGNRLYLAQVRDPGLWWLEVWLNLKFFLVNVQTEVLPGVWSGWTFSVARTASSATLSICRPLFFPFCVHRSGLCLSLYSCPANRFINIIFLDSIHMR